MNVLVFAVLCGCGFGVFLWHKRKRARQLDPKHEAVLKKLAAMEALVDEIAAKRIAAGAHNLPR